MDPMGYNGPDVRKWPGKWPVWRLTGAVPEGSVVNPAEHLTGSIFGHDLRLGPVKPGATMVPPSHATIPRPTRKSIIIYYNLFIYLCAQIRIWQNLDLDDLEPGCGKKNDCEPSGPNLLRRALHIPRRQPGVVRRVWRQQFSAVL